MKTLTKKSMFKVSIVLVLAMMVNMIACIAPAFAASDDSTVIYASGFGDYTADGRPEGWIAPKYIGSNPETAPTGSNITYVSDNENNNVIKITGAHNTAKDIIPFNKVIRSGKIHISFDGKHTQEKESESNRYSRVILFNDYNPGNYLSNNGEDEIKNYSGSDKNDFRGFAFGHHTTTLLHIPYQTDEFVTTTQKGGWGSKDVASSKKATTNEWYHIDMIIDVTNKTYDTWMDGSKLNETPGKWTDTFQKNLTGFKGFTLLENEGGQFDNIIVTHYATNDNVQMVLDSGKTTIGPDSADGKLLKVNFNDYLSTTFRDSDFEVKDNDGNAVTGVKVSKTDNTNNGCTLDFSAAEGLKANTLYTVKLIGSINGTATNVSATGACAQFRTAPKKVDTTASDYRFYYADEDFDSFTDKNHLPLGFYRANQLSTAKAKNATYKDTVANEQFTKYLSTGGNGSAEQLSIQNGSGNAMQLKNNSPSMLYFFPRGIITDNFTVEFDLKYKSGEWSLGLLPTRNWMNTDFQDNRADGGYIDNYRQINSLIGMSWAGNAAENIKAPNLAVVDDDTNNASINIPVTAKDTGLDITAEKWSHIKLDFDMADGKFDITLTEDGGKTESKTDVSYGEWNKFANGVEGLILRKGNSTDTSSYLDIDNLKVYTTSSKLLDQDFNGYTSVSQKRFPYFWISKERLQGTIKTNRTPNNVKPTAARDAYSVSGKSGESGDHAVKFTGNDNKHDKWYTTQFANRVPVGQSYAIEFDMKVENSETVWTFGPVDATRTTDLVGYNNVGDYSKADNKDWSKNLSNTNLLGGYNGKVYYYGATNQQYNINGYFGNLTNSKYFTECGSVTNEVYHHYKLVAIPQANCTTYKLKIDNGEEVTFSDKLDNHTKEICGIALYVRNYKYTTGSSWGVHLDNMQAYLCDSNGTELKQAAENSILDIKAEKADGTKVSVLNSDTIPYSTKKIAIVFSEELNETRKQDLTPIELSDDANTEDRLTNGKTITATAKTTAIYNCIEDVIQLREKSKDYPMSNEVVRDAKGNVVKNDGKMTAAPGYSSEISGNKYIITLKDMIGVGETWSLHIAKNVNFASSPYSVLDKSYSMTFTGANDEDGYLLSDCQLVKKSGENYESVTDLSDIQANEQNLGIKLSGINTTGSEKKMRAIVAFYDDSQSSAKLVNLAMVDFDFAAVATANNQVKELNVNSLAEGKTYSSVKVFVWDSESLVPMMNVPISY